MRKVDADTRWVDYDAWSRVSLSYGEWWALPPVEWVRATLPWSVEWARMDGQHGFLMGGPDPLVMDWPWVVGVHAPWKLWMDDYAFISWEDEAQYPRVVGQLAHLAVLRVVEVMASSEPVGGMVFVFSDGTRLDTVLLHGPEWRSVSVSVHVWGGTLLVEDPDRAPGADVVDGDL